MKVESVGEAHASSQKNRLGTAAVVLSLFLAAVDSTIVSTVLPRMSEHLGNPSLYPWVMSAFLLPVALVAPLAGACADRLGISKTLTVSMIVFLAASVLAARSGTMQTLILARALQGCGAGSIIVLSYALLAALYRADQRGKMQGLLSSVWGISAILGPLLGSLLASAFSWRAIFWINIPLGLVALALLLCAPKAGKNNGRMKLDWFAQVFLIVLACAVMLLMSQQTIPGLTVRVLSIAAIVALILLVIRIRQSPDRSPVPTAFFCQKSLMSVFLLVLLSSAGLYASVTLLPIALAATSHEGMSTGFLITVAALGWVFGAAICGNKLAGSGYMKLALTGMLMLMIGCLAMTLAMPLQFVSLMAASLALIGLGMGFTATTTLVFVQNSAPADRIGSWTSTVQFLRNMGAAVGVNALASVQMLTGNNFQICFLVLAGIMIPGVIAAIGLPKTYTHRA